MFTEVFIIDFPDRFDDLCADANDSNMAAAWPNTFFDLPVQFLRGFVQIHAKQDVWLAGPVLAHVLRLLIKAGVYRVVLIPSY